MIVPLAVMLTFSADGPFGFAGKLNKLAVGGKVAPAVGGLPIAIRLSDKGQKIEPTQFDLKLPDGKPVKVTFEEASCTAGVFSATVKVDANGQLVQGVRLDLRGAVESYTSNNTAKSRAQNPTLDSPLYFGDFRKDDTRSLDITVKGLEFKPETTGIDLNLSLSGVLYTGQIELGSMTVYAIDAEPGGTFLVAANEGLYRVAQGKATPLIQNDEMHFTGVVADPAGGFWAAANNCYLIRYTAEGKELSRAQTDDENLLLVSFGLRRGPGGVIFNAADNQRGWQAIKYGKKSWYLTAEGDSAFLFDVDAKGNLFATNSKKLFFIPAGAEAAKELAGPVDERPLGSLLNPISCRLDGKGQVYVTEGTPGGDFLPRMSVFDTSGRFVRMFGRGANEAPDPDSTWPGQVIWPSDLAFSADGSLHILSTHQGEGVWLMSYRPF